MRKVMREDQARLEEARSQQLSERKKNGDILVEKWSKRKDVGEGLDDLYDKNPSKARGLSFILENQQRHLKNLTETQISSTFTTAPNNVIRIVRLGYPNSVRGDIFLDWPMETARDSIFYLSPTYGSSKRGATAGDVTHESSASRYASEIEEEDVTGTINGVNKTFTGGSGGNLVNPPIRPYTLRVLHNGKFVAVDNGSGTVIGDELDSAATNTIDYTTGALTINFTTAPASGDTVQVQYFFDSEESSQYTDIGEVNLVLRDYLFRAKPWPLGVSWSKMTEILLNSTLGIDAEEALIKGAAELLKQSLDEQALLQGYRYAKANTLTEFDADFATAGADSEVAHAQSFTKALDNAGDTIFNAIRRGGISKLYGGSGAVNFLKLHNRFKADDAQPKIGAHKVGMLDGIDVYKVPTDIVPTNELVGVWKNENETNDAGIAFGTLIPIYKTQTLEYKSMYKEQGLAHFGDNRVLNSKYMVRIKLNNLS